MVGDPGDGPITVRLVSCRNDTGVRLAARLLRRLGGGRVALVEAGEAGEAVPDYGVILCPPDCPT
jgi:hypothetical protein